MVDHSERKHPLASFLEKLVEGDKCLVWKAATNDSGYGQLSVDGEIIYAHRWVYEQINGPIPFGMEICHVCYKELAAAYGVGWTTIQKIITRSTWTHI